MDPTLKDGLTFGIAGAGLLLGIYNTYKANTKDTIKLDITAEEYVGTPDQPCVLVIIRNAGRIPATISKVGFISKDPHDHEWMSRSGLPTDMHLPHTIEPGRSGKFYAHHTTLALSGHVKYKGIRVETESGKVITATSRTLESMISRYKARELRREAERLMREGEGNHS